MTPEGLPVLELSGTPRNRGEVHGEQFRDKIASLYGGWAYGVEKTTGKTVAEVSEDFVLNTRIAQAMQTWAPGLYAELQGMASAANLPFNGFFMFNSTDENEWFLKYRGYDLDLPEARGCSSVSVAGDTRYAGQNMDIPGATEGFQVLLHIKHENSDLESYVVSLTGMLALMGLNNTPLGVVNNSLRQLNSRIDGLPVNVMVRALLEQNSLNEAINFIRSAPHASGQNYILASDTGAAMFECSANGATYIPEKDGRLFHTNHPLNSPDVNEDNRFNINGSSSDTVVRLKDLEATMTHEGFDAVAEALRSHRDPSNPVCRHLTNRKTNYSAASVVYELKQPPVLHVVPGPPCLNEFRRFEFQASGSSAKVQGPVSSGPG